MTQKTLLFLNLRFSNFYSKELIALVKKQMGVRIVAILDQQFKDKIPAHVAGYLDQIHWLDSETKDGFLAEFDVNKLRPFVKSELETTSDLRIVCSDEFNLLNAGRLRREYGLAGHTDKELFLYRNKIKMKEVLANQGVRVPKFRVMKSTDNYRILQEEIGLPFVVKPVDSCGSHGVFLIREENDFNHFTTEICHFADKFEVEEFIEGALFHVDSLTRDGRIKFICANEYSCPNYEYTKGKVLSSIPLESDHPTAIRLTHAAKKCLQVLGANNLVNHMELFINVNDEIVFLEVSARPPGALLNLTHRINFGINLMDEDFFMQTGIDIDLKLPQSVEKAFWALFPLKPGRVVKLQHPVIPSFCDMSWFVKEGDEIKSDACQNIVGKAAHAVIYNSDRDVLLNDFQLIKYHQAIEVAGND